ncbi:YlbF family regulator [Streptococcus iniae]|uniref:YlbF family regulator n=1 Tax=Streptococcus iniae TaxID=1346 RepID=UPI002B29899D|nr:YlbF family regulator [Streptococcus iniae]WNZ89506.1 YlbF family regulator [Streptococcus iniae]WNZ91139.1 YlbF family regulator [Streptococcus iniae]WNZ98255.1 YlbF family regulator [Streptococcus iniae]
MLVINEDLLAIEDAIDQLVNDIKQTKEYKNYCQLRNVVKEDSNLQADLAFFRQLKETYDKEIAFASFRPEVKALKKELLLKKRQLDLNAKIMALRYAEVDLQKILAHVSVAIAEAISPTIFVDTGLPLVAKKESPHKGPYQNIKEKDDPCLQDNIE